MYRDSDFKFVEAENTQKFSDVLRVIKAAHPELTREEQKARANKLHHEERQAEYFVSTMFQVAKRVLQEEDHGFSVTPTYLSIKRHDREPIGDWRAMQKIKNAICGQDWEGFEIYPAEWRLVDTANQYHMFCFNEVLPIFVFTRREVLTSKEAEERNEKVRRLNGGEHFVTKQR